MLLERMASPYLKWLVALFREAHGRNPSSNQVSRGPVGLAFLSVIESAARLSDTTPRT